MKQLLRLTATVAALLWFGLASAQTRVIQGTVKDENGKAVPYMAIQVKGTTIGTYTDTSGHFTLAVDSTSKTLMLSYPSMKSQEVAISDNMLITMKNDALGLSEVVVTAIGIPTEKKALGYATQVVGSDDLNKSGTGDFMNELQGKVAGLTINNSSGDPGSGTFMVLRGMTSLTGNNQPLIVVDGIPLDNSINNYDPTDAGAEASGANGNLTGGVQPTNRGLDINPNDIESITVLKGPAATALYGIEAASGALIITTKKGGKGKGKGLGIEFNSSETWSTYNKLPDRQSTWSQGAWANDADPTTATYYGPTAPTSNKKFSWGPPISQLSWTGVSNVWDPHGNIGLNGTDSAKIPVTAYNPYDFFQTGVSEDNNISFSGGGDKTGFRVALGNMHQTGIVPNSNYWRTNINLGGQAALSKRLAVESGLNFVNTSSDKIQQGSNTSGLMLGLLRTPPTFDNSWGLSNPNSDSASYELPDGTQRNYRDGPGYDNPYWTVNRNTYHENVNRVYGYGKADFHVNDWITLTYRLGGDVYSQSDKNVYDIFSNGIGYGSGAIYIDNTTNAQYNSDFIITLDRKITQDIKMNVVLGQNYFSQNSQNYLQSGTNFIVPGFLDFSNATATAGTEGESKLRRSAYYIDAQFGWKDQVFLTLTGRDETTSTLAANNDNFFYPSVSLGWVFTQAFHLSDNNIFPYGKLRVSWAQVGKDAPTEALQTYYHTASLLDGFTSGVSFPFPNSVGGYQISNIITVEGNPSLLPEKTNSTEFGVDLGFLKNRIGLSFTYYTETTTNEIFQVPIPYSTGFAADLLNAGKLTNQGEEVTLTTTPVQLSNGFRWDLGINWSHNQNEVVSLAPGVSALFIGGFQNGGIYAQPGLPFGEIYGTDYVHVNPKDPSSPLLIDDNKNDEGYGMPIPGSKDTALANTQPKWIGGLTTSVTFKGITLAAIFSVREGGSIWNGTQGAMAYFGTAAETENRGTTTVFNGDLGHLDASGNVVHYTDPAQTNTAAGAGTANNVSAMYSQYYWQNVGSSFVGPTITDIQDGSYIRLNQLSLSYQIPSKWIQRAHLQNLAITIFANNLWLSTKYTGVDPETSLAGPANAQGLDYFNNPSTKSYGVRLNLGL